ncbi:hypothetical protein [Streptococcus suis]|uniref:hypothetical protein n=1 Tax=Streptococcus suis TaxID=1307 RepID=UPI001EDEC828|nr:hypothetical protein [Streptococcus suis]
MDLPTTEIIEPKNLVDCLFCCDSIVFKGEAKELPKKIPLGDDWNALQSNRYTNFNNLFTSANTDELFSKTFENDGDERSYHSEEFDDGFETNQ